MKDCTSSSTNWNDPRRLTLEAAVRRSDRIVGRIHRTGERNVRQNVFLKDMNVDVDADDAQQIEVPTEELSCYGGCR